MVKGTTAGAMDKFVGSRSASVGNCGNDDYPGSDLVYSVTSDVAGMLTVDLVADYIESYVHARPACPSSKNQDIACYYRHSEGITTITFPVDANTSYYVAADSWNNRSGDFTMTLSLQ